MSQPRWPIIEGILTTENVDGSVNVAPMGPKVEGEFASLLLRPFPGSKTYENLLRTKRGTFHVTDDVEMIAQAAVGDLKHAPEFLVAGDRGFHVLRNCCRWYQLEAVQIQTEGDRASLSCRVQKSGKVREFSGLNRAKNAILELAIIATRIHLLSSQEIDQAIETMQSWVEKTGAEAELRAWKFLKATIAERRNGHGESSGR